MKCNPVQLKKILITIIGLRFTASYAVTGRGVAPFDALKGRSVKAPGEAQRNPVS
jgi:hypothetical protein